MINTSPGAHTFQRDISSWTSPFNIEETPNYIEIQSFRLLKRVDALFVATVDKKDSQIG